MYVKKTAQYTSSAAANAKELLNLKESQENQMITKKKIIVIPWKKHS